MNDTPSTVKYVMDTSMLVGFSRWIPISLNKSFWDKLELSLQEGKWILLDIVVNEVRGNKPLEDWCRRQKANSRVSNINDDDKNGGIKINNDYPMIDQITFKSETDTYIIAYALNNKIGVFSAEMQKLPNEKLYKIPDVCRELNVRFTHIPKEFLLSVDYRN
jgi:hypothetical protein